MSTAQTAFMLVLGSKERLLIDLNFGTSGDIPSQYFAHKVTELVKQACEIMPKA